MRKWNRFRKKAKNFILKGITFLSGASWIISGICLDSECWVPFFITLIIASAWLFIFSYANDF